jgi:hypothetical protein
VAREERKLQRAVSRSQGEGGKAKRKAVAKAPTAPELPDPLSASQLKTTALRLGLPLLAVWMVGGFVAGLAQSSTVKGIALGVPATLTVAAVVLVGWAVRYARKAKGVQNLLRNAESVEDRQKALAQLSGKKSDVTAVFAKAQLLMQDDPRKALEVLEQVDLAKVMAPVADEARAQRAMIHLMYGEVKEARPLADGIELSRHQDAKQRALMAAVVAEAWARTGQAKKARETLELYDPEEDDLEHVRPQLYRAMAYAYAHNNDIKAMHRALKRLLVIDARLLGGFMAKRTHPLLQKDAKKLLEQSGQVPRRVEVVRR